MKNAKLFLELIKEKRDEIDDKIKEAYKKANSLQSGMFYTVEVYEDGDVQINGAFTSGTITMSSYEGRSYVIKKLNGWEVDGLDYEQELLQSDEKLYAEFLSSDYKREGAYSFLYNKHSKKLEEIESLCTECLVDEYDSYTDIEQAIQELEDIIDSEKYNMEETCNG
jgi:hypothetical protein